MLYEISRIIQGGAAVCRHASTAAARVEHEHLFPAALQPRDYAVPNPTWNPETKRLYEELSRDPSWRRLPSYEEFAGSRSSMSLEADGETRFFTRNLDQEGIGFEYCMFYNEAEKRTVCIFQPGPYLGGLAGRALFSFFFFFAEPTLTRILWFLGLSLFSFHLSRPLLPSSRYTHGGCIATILDSTVGAGIVNSIGPAMTANLNLDYRSPIPLGSTVLIDSRVEKVDGQKVYTRCQVRSHDSAVLHSEATALYVMLKSGESEARL
ncbi:acyl-coenzyme A thioesterase THEM4-like isoform X2 [Lithobates pipiens]